MRGLHSKYYIWAIAYEFNITGEWMFMDFVSQRLFWRRQDARDFIKQHPKDFKAIRGRVRYVPYRYLFVPVSVVNTIGPPLLEHFVGKTHT